MPGKLGKCPTCGRQVSTNAESCPHCGESGFYENANKATNTIIDCNECGGKGSVSCSEGDGDHSLRGFFQRTCTKCGGHGRVKVVDVIQTDIRTGDEKLIEQEYGRVSAVVKDMDGCGCIVMVAALLTLASALMIAVLI